MKVTATNACGTSTIVQDVYPPATDPCIGKIAIQNQKFIINPCKGSFAKSALIYNFRGEILEGYSLENNDISNLPVGLYIIKAELNTGEVLTKKITKL